MATTFTIEHCVQFSETDMAGIVHFSNYFRWMEYAENAFFQELKLPLVEFSPEKIAGWPRVDVGCSFSSPARFQDTIQINLSVQQVKNHSILYEFEFHKKKEGEINKIAKGHMTTVYAIFDPFKNEIKASLIEESLLHSLAKYTVTPKTNTHIN